VVGTTNMHELAAGVTNLESSFGPTRNPWDPSRMTGGSSGGSAAAVASGVVPLGLVSDTGGSARIPASLCGVWGLKASLGRLPLDGMMPLAPEMDCAGLIAGTLDDLRAGLRTLAGDMGPEPIPERIGVLRDGRWDRCAAEVRAAVDDAASLLGSRHVEVRDVDGSELDDVHHVWNRIAWPSFAAAYEGLADDPALGPGCAAVVRWGRDHRDERAAALARAKRIRTWFTAVFDEVDLLLTAATPYAAPRFDATEVDLGDGTTMDVLRGGPAWFTTAANVAGLPAISGPFAWTDSSLPIGVQLIGPANGEGALLSAGALLHVPESPPLPGTPMTYHPRGRRPAGQREA
jgi:aspartyl-tRNA(Asn)/glutamyl-tRNA(Gln) amidotransferase subunit A